MKKIPKKGDTFPEGTYSLFLNNYQSQLHKEAGGKRKKRSDSQSSGKKKRNSFHGLKKPFHGFDSTGVMHSQEPLLDTYSKFTSSNFQIYVYGAVEYFQKQ